MAVVVKMWHYIWHDLLNALLRFQRVSRSRPLREGKHALAPDHRHSAGRSALHFLRVSALNRPRYLAPAPPVTTGRAAGN